MAGWMASVERVKRSVAWLAVLVLCVASVACSSVSGGIKSPTLLPRGSSVLEPGRTIGRLAVSIDERLPADVIDVAERYQVARMLDSRVREHLPIGDMRGGGDLDVAVQVIGMRIRSNGTAIWWGVASGRDWITVDVDVTAGGRSIKRFQTRAATALGGFAYGGRNRRFERMLSTLAERIAEGI
jgi:hypothetical protein